MNIEEKKKFAIDVITHIKKIDDKIHSAYKLGIDLIEFSDNDMLLKSLSMLFAKNEKQRKSLEDEFSWWMYDLVDKKKIITIVKTGKKYDVTKLDKFLDYIVEWYKL